MDFLGQLTKILNVISTEVVSCIPIVDEGAASKECFQAVPLKPNTTAGAQNLSAFRPKQKFGDSVLSPAEADAKGNALFGSANVLTMLSVAISEGAQGRVYRNAQSLSSLVQPYSFDLHKFIRNCPPGSPEWRALLAEFEDGQPFWSTGAQVVLHMLPTIRITATNWVRKDAAEKAKARAEASETTDDAESDRGGAPSSLSPGLGKHKDEKNPLGPR
jgi:hypothetical protein